MKLGEILSLIVSVSRSGVNAALPGNGATSEFESVCFERRFKKSPITQIGNFALKCARYDNERFRTTSEHDVAQLVFEHSGTLGLLRRQPGILSRGAGHHGLECGDRRHATRVRQFDHAAAMGGEQLHDGVRELAADLRRDRRSIRLATVLSDWTVDVHEHVAALRAVAEREFSDYDARAPRIGRGDHAAGLAVAVESRVSASGSVF